MDVLSKLVPMNENPLEQFINKNSNRAEEYHEIIEEMMGNHYAYGYAESTLLGILDYIDENDTITDSQVQAVNNIKEKPNEGHTYNRYK
jgi:hypothetical protein